MEQRVSIGALADSTQQRYAHTIKSLEEFLTSRNITELRNIDRALIEAFKVFRHARITEKNTLAKLEDYCGR